MPEINPNHPVTNEFRENWFKFVAIILHKFKLGTVVITIDDMKNLTDDYPEGMPTVVAESKNEQIELRLVSEKEARRLSRKEGGLPI